MHKWRDAGPRCKMQRRETGTAGGYEAGGDRCASACGDMTATRTDISAHMVRTTNRVRHSTRTIALAAYKLDPFLPRAPRKGHLLRRRRCSVPRGLADALGARAQGLAEHIWEGPLPHIREPRRPDLVRGCESVDLVEDVFVPQVVGHAVRRQDENVVLLDGEGYRARMCGERGRRRPELERIIKLRG